MSKTDRNRVGDLLALQSDQFNIDLLVAISNAKKAPLRPVAQNTDDPTKTITIRSAWNRELTRRFRGLKGAINRFILDSELQSTSEFAANQAFDFKSDPRAVAEFLVWLEGQIDRRILENKTLDTANELWQNQYINRAYLRGVRVARADLRKQAPALGALLQDVQPAQIIGTATPSLGFGIPIATGLTGPIHLAAIQTLYTRDFAQLKGITDTMSQQISRVLVDGVEQGLGARDVAKGINDRVDKIGLTRAKLLARTETVRAYNLGTINEGEDFTARTGIQVKYEWRTREDNDVRDTHIARNRKFFTASEARRLIGEPNCRCALITTIVDPEGEPIE